MIKELIGAACFCACFVHQACYALDQQDPDALFKEAMQYRENGDIFKSIEIFQRILNLQPDLNRARLELAVSYHLSRRYEEARLQLIKVLNDTKTPEHVKLAITGYLAQLSSDIKSSQKRSSSSFYLSIGALTDSNITLSPDLPAAASEESASGGQFMFSYSHRSRASKPLNLASNYVDFEWLSQATAYAKAYASGKSDFNLSVLTLNTGPALIAEKSWRGAFNFKLDKLYFGNQSYAEYTGINPLFTYSLLPDLEITLENNTTRREYNQIQDQGLQGTLSTWNLDFAKFYTNQSIGVQAGIRYHDNGANSAFLHYTGAELYLGAQAPAWKDARIYLSVSTRDYRYKAADTGAGFTEKRDETELLSVLGLSHNFRTGTLKSWTLNAEYTYTDNESNLIEFEYQRNTFELNMRRYFF